METSSTRLSDCNDEVGNPECSIHDACHISNLQAQLQVAHGKTKQLQESIKHWQANVASSRLVIMELEVEVRRLDEDIEQVQVRCEKKKGALFKRADEARAQYTHLEGKLLAERAVHEDEMSKKDLQIAQSRSTSRGLHDSQKQHPPQPKSEKPIAQRGQVSLNYSKYLPQKPHHFSQLEKSMHEKLSSSLHRALVVSS